MKDILRKRLKLFFFPKLNRRYLFRIAIVLVLSVIVFKFFLIPMKISGSSMEPSYHDGSINFCRTFMLGEFKRGDVINIRLAGKRVMYLKRIVAFEGETIEFRRGKLFVNGVQLEEKYVKLPCEWELSARTVENGCVYVVGDNRSTPTETHQFGQAQKSKIMGRPLW
jgi:signal peptidase I